MGKLRVFLASLSLMAIATHALRDEEEQEQEQEQEFVGFLRKEEIGAPPNPTACWKDIVSGGHAQRPDGSGNCPSGYEKSFGLCYAKCASGFKRLGPFCVESCVGEFKFEGALLCCDSEETCKDKMNDLTEALPKAIAQVVEDSKNGVPFGQQLKDFKELIKDVEKLELPLCDKQATDLEVEELMINNNNNNNNNNNKGACFKDLKSGGKGTFPPKGGECPADTEKAFGLCYPKCGAGFSRVGPLCLEQCSGELNQDGLIFCCDSEETCKEKIDDLGVELPKAIARAAKDANNGVPISQVFADLKELIKDLLDIDVPLCDQLAPQEDNDDDDDEVEVDKKRRHEFHACWKDAKARGIGKIPKAGKCEDENHEKSFGLCYPKCADGYSGLGAVCWENCISPRLENGILFCCDTKATCKDKLKDLGLELPKAVLKAATDIAIGINPIAVIRDLRRVLEDVMDVTLPLCNHDIHHDEDDAIGITVSDM